MVKQLSPNQKIGFGLSAVALSIVVATSPAWLLGLAGLLGLLWALWDVL